jgi:lysophospholipase L1-like esterase
MHNILLVGSSIFALWETAPGLVPGHRVRNRAVGGTTTAYWREHIGEVLAQEAPGVVLFYCGSNDLNLCVPVTDIIDGLLWCRRKIGEVDPAIRTAYFGIIKAPQKAGRWDDIDRINGAIRAGWPVDDLYVETNQVFAPQGWAEPRWFVEDGLHLTGEAYEELSTFTRPLLTRWMEAGSR